jgi:endonuclease G, mitochondrial
MLNEPARGCAPRRPVRARRRLRATAFVVLAIGSGPATAQDTAQDLVFPALPALRGDACPQHFAAGRRPDLTNPKLAQGAVPLCFLGFAVLFSGLARTPLYAAEHLTAARLAEAQAVDRVDAFHPEEALPPDVRSELADYVGSGYDRGHMAPSGDMPDAEAQRQSFSLANIVPQDPQDNRGLWSDIEQAVRRLARTRGEIYVVTGPIFEGGTLASLKGRVLVPTRLFKAVYDPASRTAAAYVAENAPGRAWRAVAMDALRADAGIDPFPGAAVDGVLRLPAPEERPAARRERQPETAGEWIEAQARRFLRRLWREMLRAVLG